jgi:hypothetical protein
LLSVQPGPARRFLRLFAPLRPWRRFEPRFDSATVHGSRAETSGIFRGGLVGADTAGGFVTPAN